MISSMSTSFRTKISILFRIVRLVSSIPTHTQDPSPTETATSTATEPEPETELETEPLPVTHTHPHTFSKLEVYLSTSQLSSQFPLLYRALDLAITFSEPIPTKTDIQTRERKHKLMDLVCVFGLGFIEREIKQFEKLVEDHRCPKSHQFMRRPVQNLRDKKTYDLNSLKTMKHHQHNRIRGREKIQFVELAQVREFVVDLRRQWGVCALNLLRLLERFGEYWRLEKEEEEEGEEEEEEEKETTMTEVNPSLLQGSDELLKRIYVLVIECAAGAHWRTCEESYSELLDLAFEFYARSPAQAPDATSHSNATILLETLVLRIRKFILVSKATGGAAAGGVDDTSDHTQIRSARMCTFLKEYCEVVLPRLEAYFRGGGGHGVDDDSDSGDDGLLMGFAISLEKIVRGLDEKSESEAERSLVHHALRDLSHCYLACGRSLQGLRVLREFVDIVCSDLDLLDLLFRLLRQCTDSDGGDYEGLFEMLLNRVRSPGAQIKVLECGLKLRPGSSILINKLLRSVESGDLGERDFSKIGWRVIHVLLQRFNQVNHELGIFKKECGVALTQLRQRNEELSTQNEILLGTIRSMKNEFEEFRVEFRSHRAKRRRRPKLSSSSPSSPTREVRPPPKAKDIVWVTEDGVLVEESTESLDTFTKYSPHSAPLPLPPDEEDEEGELELNTVTRQPTEAESPKPELPASSRPLQRKSSGSPEENPQSPLSVRPSPSPSRRIKKNSRNGLVPYSRRRLREPRSAPSRIEPRKEPPIPLPPNQVVPTASMVKDRRQEQPSFSRVVAHPWTKVHRVKHFLRSHQLDCEWILSVRDLTFVIMKNEDDANSLLRKSHESGGQYRPSGFTSISATEVEIDFNVFCDDACAGEAVKWLDQKLGRQVNASYQPTTGLETLTVRARLNSLEELQLFAAPGRDLQMPYPGGFRFPCQRQSPVYWVEFTRNRSFNEPPATSKREFYFDLLAYCGRFGRVVKIVLQDSCQGVAGFNCPFVAALLAGSNRNSPFFGNNLSSQGGIPPVVRDFHRKWWNQPRRTPRN